MFARLHRDLFAAAPSTALAATALAVIQAAGCSASVQPADSTSRSKEPSMTQHSRGEAGSGIANLPYARGRTFHSLDDYLAHLEANGAIDLPYWREVRPGLYEWMVRMPEAGPRETATREQLMRRYGFTR